MWWRGAGWGSTATSASTRPRGRDTTSPPCSVPSYQTSEEFIFFNVLSAGIDCLQRLYCTDWGPVVAARSLGLVATEAATPLKKLIMQHAS